MVADTESVFDVFDCEAINKILVKAGLPPDLTPEYMRHFAGIPSENKLEIIAREKGIDASPYIKAFIAERNTSRPNVFRDNKVKLARNFDSFIASYGDRCILVTNKNREKLDWDLEALEMGRHFPRIVCLAPPMQRKPAPDLLLKALQLIDAKTIESAYVGDNELDMEAAVAANIYPIGFVIEGLDKRPERGLELRKAGAQMVIDDFGDLSRLVI